MAVNLSAKYTLNDLQDRLEKKYPTLFFKPIHQLTKWFNQRCCGAPMQRFEAFYKTSGVCMSKRYVGCIWCGNVDYDKEYNGDGGL